MARLDRRNQDFLNKARPTPSPAMVKGYLMNSAAYMTGAGAGATLPSNNQGVGRMDLARAFDATPRLLVDQTEILHATGQTFTLSGSVASAAQPFRVTLAWSDAPGTTAGSPWVNDLDLEVSVGGITYLGNVFSGAESAPGGATDIKNNVESVFLPAGTTGDFTVTVRAANGVPGNDDPTDQDFALIVYNAGDGAPAIPRIGPSPAALSFSGIAGAQPGQPDPEHPQHRDEGLDFSAGTDAPWLTLSSGSGTAPASLCHGRRLRRRRRRVDVLGERAAIDQGLPAHRDGLRRVRARRQRHPGHHHPRRRALHRPELLVECDVRGDDDHHGVRPAVRRAVGPDLDGWRSVASCSRTPRRDRARSPASL